MENKNVPLKLTNDLLRIPLEHFISKHLGQRWTVKAARDMADFACHPAAILSDGSYSVFAKFSDAANGLEQFEIEIASLRFLSKYSGVLIPTVIGIIPVPGGCIFILEAVPSVERTPFHWQKIGQALASLHKVKSDRFGFETHGYFGPLYQDNTAMKDWAAFYAERRLIPGMKMAIDAGNLSGPIIKQLERIIYRLPELCGPEVSPSLLHGDAQQNNFITAETGVFMIDPAVYFGHPEMDLAYIDYFQSVPDDFFVGYAEELSIDPGFWGRRSLWRLWGYLAAVTVEGTGYISKLTDAIQHYV